MSCPNCRNHETPIDPLDELLLKANNATGEFAGKPIVRSSLRELIQGLATAVKDLRAANSRLHKLADVQLHENGKLCDTLKYLRERMAEAREALREEE